MSNQRRRLDLRRGIILSAALVPLMAGCSQSSSSGDRSTTPHYQQTQQQHSIRAWEDIDVFRCKSGERKVVTYPKFPFFLQMPLWGSRMFFSHVGSTFQARAAPPFNHVTKNDAAKRFEAAAMQYVDEADSLYGRKPTRFTSPAFQSNIFGILLKNYAAFNMYAKGIESRALAIAQTSGAGGIGASSADRTLYEFIPPHEALGSSSSEPEVILLTSAINLSTIRSSDRPVEAALRLVIKNVRHAEFYKWLLSQAECLSCISYRGPWPSGVPDSLQSGSGVEVWKILLLRQLRNEVINKETLRRYIEAYERYIGDYYVGRLYGDFSQDPNRFKRYKLLRQFYPANDVERALRNGMCDHLLPHLYWDVDLMELARQHKIAI